MSFLMLCLLFWAGQVWADITTGLQVYLKADDVSGITAPDSAGGDHDGTLVGNTTTSATAHIGTLSFLFDGAGDSITGPIPTLTNTVTIAAWVQRTVDAIQELFTTDQSGGSSYGMYLRARTDGTRCGVHNGTTLIELQSTQVIAINAWHHITCTYDGVNIRLYYDGTETSQSPAAQTGNLRSVSIDAYQWAIHANGTANPYTGYMDDLRLYSRALSAGDITELVAYTGITRKRVIITTQRSLPW